MKSFTCSKSWLSELKYKVKPNLSMQISWDKKKKKKDRDKNRECDGLAEFIMSACTEFQSRLTFVFQDKCRLSTCN